MNQKVFILALAMCIGVSVTPPILLMYGLAQFKIQSLVGAHQVLATFGYSTALVSILMIGLSPVIGTMADRLFLWWGHWQGVLVAGSLFGGIALLGFALSTTLLTLLICWLLVLGGYGLVGAACTALIASSVASTSRGRSYGMVGIAVPLCGMGCGILILGGMASSTLLTKLIVIALLQFGVCLLTCRVLHAHWVAPTRAEAAVHHRIPLLALFRDYPAFSWVFCCKLSLNTVLASLKMMPLFYIARLHLSETEVYQLNAMTAAGTVLLIVTSILSGIVLDRRGYVRTLQAMTCIMMAMAMAGYMVADQRWHIVLLSCLTSLALGIGGPAGNVLINRVLPDPDSYVRDISVMQSSMYLGAAIIGLIGPGWVVWCRTQFGGDGFAGFFLLQALLALLAGLSVLMVRGAGYSQR